MKTPHRASSLCCHETNDGRMAKLNHTPSMKAGQLSRHSCYPEGGTSKPRYKLDQSTKQDNPRGGKAKGTEKGTTTKEDKQQRKQQGPPKHSEGRNKTRKTTRRTNRSTKPTQSHEPRRATHAGNHKTTKGTEGSTDHTCAERSALDQSKGKKQTKEKTRKRGVHTTRRKETKK